MSSLTSSGLSCLSLTLPCDDTVIKRNWFMNQTLEKMTRMIFGLSIFRNLQDILAAFPIYFYHVILLWWISNGQGYLDSLEALSCYVYSFHIVWLKKQERYLRICLASYCLPEGFHKCCSCFAWLSLEAEFLVIEINLQLYNTY